MVWVPTGPFIMGLDEADANTIARHLGFKAADDPFWAWILIPRRKVNVAGFFIINTKRPWRAGTNSSRLPAIDPNRRNKNPTPKDHLPP